MDIGILITQDAFADKIFEVADAALQRGHSIRIFMTDDGVMLLNDPRLASFLTRGKVEISFCNFSSQSRKIDESKVPAGITSATQYQNSLMHNECDKILVF